MKNPPVRKMIFCVRVFRTPLKSSVKCALRGCDGDPNRAVIVAEIVSADDDLDEQSIILSVVSTAAFVKGSRCVSLGVVDTIYYSRVKPKTCDQQRRKSRKNK